MLFENIDKSNYGTKLLNLTDSELEKECICVTFASFRLRHTANSKLRWMKEMCEHELTGRHPSVRDDIRKRLVFLSMISDIWSPETCPVEPGLNH